MTGASDGNDPVFTSLEPARARLAFPADWPDELFVAMGKMAVAAGQLEYLVAVAYKRAAGLDYQVVMKEERKPGQWQGRLRAILRAVQNRVTDEATLALAETLCAERGSIALAIKDRNRIMHGAFARGIYDAQVFRVPHKPDKSGFYAEPIYLVEEIGRTNDVASRLRHSLDRLTALTASVFLEEGSPLDVPRVTYASTEVSEMEHWGPAVATTGVAPLRMITPTIDPPDFGASSTAGDTSAI